jgi:hypothetical protein
MEGMALSAGAATIDITPEAGVAMGGYGARTDAATGRHDSLQGRVVVLADQHTEVAIVVCDLLGVPPLLVSELRREAESLGLEPGNVLVAATHTHAGPSVVYTRRLNDYLLEMAARLRRGIEQARQRLQPAAVRVSRFELNSISQNRRDPNGPTQRQAELLAISSSDGGAPIASVVNYACHATVLEHDNLLWSADFPGAACRFIEQSYGGVAIYLQGCCGDINPLWTAHDFDEVERIGAIVGSATVRALHELAPVGGPGQYGINLSWSENIRQDPTEGRLVVDAELRAHGIEVELRRRELASAEDIEAEVAVLRGRLEGLRVDDPVRRAITPRLNQLNMERTVLAYKQLQPPDQYTVEVQAIRIGDGCAIVSLPGEFFVQTGMDLTRAAGIDNLLIAGYANDYIGYVPPANEFANGGYEVGFARFAVESEDKIRSAAVEALASIGAVPA